MAIQMLYQSDLGGTPLPQIFGNFEISSPGSDDEDNQDSDHRPGESESSLYRETQEEGSELALEYARSLVQGTVENLEQIDDLIREQADNWRIERMPAVDRNILRLATYELLFESEVPKVVVLNEAIELAKKYGSEQSGGFVNGILDGLLRMRRFPGSLK